MRLRFRVIGLLTQRLARCWLGFALVALALAPAAALGQEAGKRLFYIGLALYSEQWSENDVVELGNELRADSRYQVVPMIASNLHSHGARYPVGDDATILSFVRTAAEQAGPQDIIFVHISTHGAPYELARRVGEGETTALSSRTLARMLAPLAGHPTIIVISACYSGSFMRDLREARRIILTAARADRSSFGCGAGNRHTLFGEAELRAFGEPDHSLHQVFTAIRRNVAGMEHRQHFTPSEPQISVGAQVGDLYEAPVF
ncbi:MAG TPA: C13 family peptidase [Acetobacteraceae bacterium]|nr:C13 family peptidase [Acetobacteraceae bacterium]